MHRLTHLSLFSGGSNLKSEYCPECRRAMQLERRRQQAAYAKQGIHKSYGRIVEEMEKEK